jgi:phosphoadenosine phosphosulfate reductase
MREHVARVEACVPHFVRVNTDVSGWIAEHGLPTDLLPHSAHPVAAQMGEAGTALVSRYTCCHANLMLPLYERIKADGNTLLIRGSKRADMNRLPYQSGDCPDGIEFFYPLQDWSNDEVFAYLAGEGVELPRVYSSVENSPECARCSAWWGEQRAAYLQRFHPELFEGYRARMRLVLRELHAPMHHLAREVENLGGLASLLGGDHVG